MAAITQRIEVCDVCKDIERPVTHYRLAPEGGRLRKLALCEEHGLPLTTLVSELHLWTGPARRSSRQVTMEQIEVVKKRQARKTTASKRAVAKKA